jgi:hypothetical protein
MRYIAHRGLFKGPDVNIENTPQQIDLAIGKGYDVEVDVWCINNELFLGHYYPLRKVDVKWLSKRPLWVHCKNVEALEYFQSIPYKLNYFWHQNDNYTLTSDEYIWVNPGNKLTESSVMVMPEHIDPNLQNTISVECFGICSDYVEQIKKLRNEV